MPLHNPDSAPDGTTPLLALRGLHVAYGGIEAVKGIDLDLHAGEVVSLIGANGAGKTTTLNTLAGLLTPSRGDILLDGRSILTLPAHQRVAAGMALVPEGRGLFARLTVAENLRMGAYTRRDPDIDADMERLFGLLPRVKERLHQLAGTLSGGEQQMVAIARALLSRPRILLLDEPSMGLAPVIVDKIFAAIRDIADSGVSILLVEQNASLALAHARRACVLDTGHITLRGTGEELLTNPQVRAAYLGE